MIRVKPTFEQLLVCVGGEGQVLLEDRWRPCLRHTGRSPMEHVTHLRMARAAALLESTPMKIAAVAGAVGYANPFAFSTAFRRAHGASPAKWRATSNARRNPRA